MSAWFSGAPGLAACCAPLSPLAFACDLLCQTPFLEKLSACALLFKLANSQPSPYCSAPEHLCPPRTLGVHLCHHHPMCCSTMKPLSPSLPRWSSTRTSLTTMLARVELSPDSRDPAGTESAWHPPAILVLQQRLKHCVHGEHLAAGCKRVCQS